MTLIENRSRDFWLATARALWIALTGLFLFIFFSGNARDEVDPEKLSPVLFDVAPGTRQPERITLRLSRKNTQ